MKMSTLYFNEGIFQNQNLLKVVFLVWFGFWEGVGLVDWLVGLGFGFFVVGGGFLSLFGWFFGFVQEEDSQRSLLITIYFKVQFANCLCTIY